VSAEPGGQWPHFLLHWTLRFAVCSDSAVIRIPRRRPRKVESYDMDIALSIMHAALLFYAEPDYRSIQGCPKNYTISDGSHHIFTSTNQ